MPKTIKPFICAALLLASTSAGAFDYSLPDRLGYRQLLEEMEIRGRVPMLKGYGPFSYQEVAGQIDNLPNENWRLGHSRALNGYDPAKDAIFFVDPQAAGNFGSDTLDGRLFNRTFGGMNIGQGHWSMAGTYYMNVGDQTAGGYYQKLWRGFSGGSDQMYIRYSFRQGNIQLGKDHLHIASGLALSDGKAFEKVQAEYQFNRHLRLLFFTGQLDKMIDSSAVYNRYLAGHRAEVTLGKVQVGFTEFAIYGGEGRTIEPYYLLPLYVFQAEQLNKPYIDDNVIWDMDIKTVVPPFRLRAEFMVDDFQIDSESPSDNEPTEAGFSLQAEWAMLDRPLFLTPAIRYQMVTDWTFNQPKPWNRFLFQGQPLGQEYGNDYDRLSLGIGLVTGKDKGRFEAYRLRKGPGSISAPWTEPWINDPGWQERFPAGLTEKRTGFTLNVNHRLGQLDRFNMGGTYCLTAEARWEGIVNQRNIAGANATDWQVRLGLEANFWTDVFKIE